MIETSTKTKPVGQKSSKKPNKLPSAKKQTPKMSKVNVEYAEYQWNPVWGCTKVSDACQICYAECTARRYKRSFDFSLIRHKLEDPLFHEKPAVIFADAMSDFFHEDMPLDYLKQIFEVMKKATQHIFLVFTKRTKRLRELCHELPWPDNVWMVVTVESEKYLERIDDLRATPAAVKVLSIEPMLGPIPDLDLTDIDWVICGGEAGQGARPIKLEWVTDLRDQCEKAGVDFFFQQWGGVYGRKKANGRKLDGRTHDDMPQIDHRAVRNLIARKNLIVSKTAELT